ncbi:tRNA-splicing endonuclease subunit [Orbilia brochopaga]
MCGTLFGTLPQAQQQNVFHGLPMELMPEEAALLVENGVAVIEDDTRAHADAVQALSEADKAAILAARTQEQDKLAQANLEESKKRKQIAIENAKASGKWKTRAARQASAEASKPDAEAESLFAAADDDNAGESAGGDGATSSTNNAVSDDSAHRQYIVPLATASIGACSLRVPQVSSHVPDPPASRYSVYKHLHSLGYYMSPGLRFGCEFVAYPGDPLRFHSHFLVKTAEWDEEVGIMDLVGGGRLGTGVKKAWMMGGRPDEGEDGNGDVRVFSVEWGGFG